MPRPDRHLPEELSKPSRIDGRESRAKREPSLISGPDRSPIMTRMSRAGRIMTVGSDQRRCIARRCEMCSSLHRTRADTRCVTSLRRLLSSRPNPAQGIMTSDPSAAVRLDRRSGAVAWLQPLAIRSSRRPQLASSSPLRRHRRSMRGDRGLVSPGRRVSDERCSHGSESLRSASVSLSTGDGVPRAAVAACSRTDRRWAALAVFMPTPRAWGHCRNTDATSSSRHRAGS